MNFRTKRRKEPQVMVVSLIDVVLQLVIFLLLTTTFKSGEQSLNITLPAAEPVHRGSAGEIIVEVDSSGNVMLDGRMMSQMELDQAFREEAMSDPERRVHIRADRLARHGDVVFIMDRARRHDLRRLSIAVLPREGPDGEI